MRMNNFRHTRLLVILQQGLLVLLAAMLVWTPIWQSAHALTHIDEIPSVLDINDPDTQPLLADASSDSGADNDRACVDCLAFAAASTFLSGSACFLSAHATGHDWLSPLFIANRARFFSSYLTRAPPV